MESQSEEDGDLVICMNEDDEEVEVAVDPEDRSHRRQITAVTQKFSDDDFTLETDFMKIF